ncbi:hypothetical protein C8R44DRAFT_752749 [Mycena epipterygia]|nr:hypothetical protein C8R44DRAFT_752749 [Mycena epipterygia]
MDFSRENISKCSIRQSSDKIFDWAPTKVRTKFLEDPKFVFDLQRENQGSWESIKLVASRRHVNANMVHFDGVQTDVNASLPFPHLLQLSQCPQCFHTCGGMPHLLTSPSVADGCGHGTALTTARIAPRRNGGCGANMQQLLERPITVGGFRIFIGDSADADDPPATGPAQCHSDQLQPPSQYRGSLGRRRFLTRGSASAIFQPSPTNTLGRSLEVLMAKLSFQSSILYSISLPLPPWTPSFLEYPPKSISSARRENTAIRWRSSWASCEDESVYPRSRHLVNLFYCIGPRLRRNYLRDDPVLPVVKSCASAHALRHVSSLCITTGRTNRALRAVVVLVCHIPYFLVTDSSNPAAVAEAFREYDDDEDGVEGTAPAPATVSSLLTAALKSTIQESDDEETVFDGENSPCIPFMCGIGPWNDGLGQKPTSGKGSDGERSHAPSIVQRRHMAVVIVLGGKNTSSKPEKDAGGRFTAQKGPVPNQNQGKFLPWSLEECVDRLRTPTTSRLMRGGKVIGRS